MKCGECTACCIICVVPELDKKAGEHCMHCNSGCSIHGNHPQSCKNFECAYYQGSNNIELRPDKCGIMFYKKNERIFVGIVVPGKEITPIAKAQISSFRQQGYSIVMLKIGEKPHILPVGGRSTVGVYTEYLETLRNGHV